MRKLTMIAAIAVTTALVTAWSMYMSTGWPQALPNEICSRCFASLEISPSLEPESYAMRGG
jgi:hypothetical protein